MRNWKTQNGYKIIQVLNRMSNAYLILKDDDIVLVDTGKKSAFQTLSKNISALNIAIEDVQSLILTHTHYDHCQSAKQIKDKSNCQIIVSYIATESIKKGYTKLPNGTILITKLIVKLGCLIGKRKLGYEPFCPDILVKDRYDVKIGSSWLKIIHTPGHSMDSISLLVDNEIAIVGDAMFGIFKNSIFPPYTDDPVKMIESWGKLLSTDCNTFLPGHGNEIKRDLLQKEYEKYARKYNIL